MTESIYLSLKLAKADKAGKHSKGQISYRILTDELHQNLFITIVGNEGGGWFSNEIVAVSKIEEVLSKLNTKIPLPTKAFASAFESKSVNNAGFLAAVLRTEGLLNAPEEGSRLHLVTQEWELWQSVMLSEPGVVYVPPVAKGLAAIAKSEKTAEASAGSAVSAGKSKLTLKIGKKPDRNVTQVATEPMALATDTDTDTDVESDAEIESDNSGLDANADILEGI